MGRSILPDNGLGFPQTIASYILLTFLKKNCFAKNSFASFVLAKTIRPDVSLSSLCTTPALFFSLPSCNLTFFLR